MWIIIGSGHRSGSWKFGARWVFVVMMCVKTTWRNAKRARVDVHQTGKNDRIFATPQTACTAGSTFIILWTTRRMSECDFEEEEASLIRRCWAALLLTWHNPFSRLLPIVLTSQYHLMTPPSVRSFTLACTVISNMLETLDVSGTKTCFICIFIFEVHRMEWAICKITA